MADVIDGITDTLKNEIKKKLQGLFFYTKGEKIIPSILFAMQAASAVNLTGEAAGLC